MNGRIGLLLCLFSLSLSAEPMPADLSIAISTSSSVVAPGEPVTYEIVTINHGPNDATGVTMTNVLPAQLLFTDISAPPGWTCATPAGGTNGTITCMRANLPVSNGTSTRFLLGTIVAFDASGSIVNSATMTHAGIDENPGNSSASSAATTVRPGVADLSITKTANAPRAPVQTAFTYTITLTNSGPDAASMVTMTDVLPPQLQFDSRVITTTPGTDFACTTPLELRGGTITCNAFRMLPGATVTMVLQLRVPSNAPLGTVTNTATVRSSTADPDSADLSATAADVEIVPSANLSIQKILTTTRARPNALVNYLLLVQNIGPNPAANVVVRDELPQDLLFDGISAGSFDCTTPAVGTSGTVTCIAETLPPPFGTGFYIRVRVAPGAKPGVVTNRATVTTSTFDLGTGAKIADAPPLTIEPPAGVERRLDPVASAPWPAQMAPQVATTLVNVLAVWGEDYVSFAPPGSAASVRGALFRPDTGGSLLISFADPEFGKEMAFPTVAAASDRYLVVWREVKSSQGRIMARRVRVDGSFIDAQPLVLETAAEVPCCTDVGDPRPAVASNGRDFYVTWVSADYEVRGILVPAEGPVTWESQLMSRDGSDIRLRIHDDLEVVWTSQRYVVLWLDRVIELEEPRVLRYARVTSGGVLLDSQSTNSIAGQAYSSITATSTEGGAVVTADYASADYTRQCVDILLLTEDGEPRDARQLRCEIPPGPPGPELHSQLIPVSGGFLLVQPGRGYEPSFQDFWIRTSTADAGLTSLSYPTLLGTEGREVAVANWRGAALLVYNRTDGDDPNTRVARIFSFLIPGHGRARAVRH